MKILIRAVMVSSAIFAGVFSPAETVTVHVKRSGGAPLASHGVLFYLAAPFTQLSYQFTDASGDVTFTDNAFVGQSRCVRAEELPLIIFYGTATNAPPVNARDHEASAGPLCGNNLALDWYVWAEDAAILGSARIVGGPRGYVNPNLHESASIIVNPKSPGVITFKIYTGRGKLVTTILKDGQAGTKNFVDWDARDSEGKVVASGIYVVHISGGGINTRGKIAVVRK